jgi:capsular polysaccharide biosynthesis protein
MYPGDARGRWRADLLPDTRVRHYWDETRAVGRLYLQLLPRLWSARAAETVIPQADALWDAYLLYPADARWDDEPPGVIRWGSTILQTQETLRRDILALVKD